MKQKIHAFAGATALVAIMSFWLSTVAAELLGTQEHIVQVKAAILYGMAVLIPALALTGATGALLGGRCKNPIVSRKKTRMQFAAGNGLFVLVPSAIFLAWSASRGMFDGWSMAVQTIELLAGVVNFTMLSLNMKDGLALSGRKRTQMA